MTCNEFYGDIKCRKPFLGAIWEHFYTLYLWLSESGRMWLCASPYQHDTLSSGFLRSWLQACWRWSPRQLPITPNSPTSKRLLETPKSESSKRDVAKPSVCLLLWRPFGFKCDKTSLWLLRWNYSGEKINAGALCRRMSQGGSGRRWAGKSF